MTRRRHSTRLGRSAWLALFALWLQALLPLVHHPAGMAMMGVASMDMPFMDMSMDGVTPVSSGDSQNICLAPGTGPAGPSDHTPAHKPPPLCPICQSFQLLHGGYIPPCSVPLAAPALFRTAHIVPPNADEPEQPIHFGARARAPPAGV